MQHFEYPTSHWNLYSIQKSLHASVYICTKKISDNWWDIPWYNTSVHDMTVLYHAIENVVASTISATYVQCLLGRLDVILSNIQCITAVLDSNWLNLLWHGVNTTMYFALYALNSDVLRCLGGFGG